MLIKDTIYGNIEINEPILVELINSPSMIRLKGVSQYGIPDKYYHYKNYSRYEHSLGVMCLLKKLNASLEEQVAGLLHDVSVLTFSHITDWVFGKGSQGIEDYHDSIHSSFVLKTEIPGILRKHGLDFNISLNSERFPLLEKELPSLCADRVDYALRDFNNYQNPRIVGSCIRHLKVYEHEIVFDDVGMALEFGRNFLQLTIKHWNGYESIIRYHIFSETLKYALEKSVIREMDFYTTEESIMSKLENSTDIDIKKAMNILAKKSLDDYPKELNKTVVKKFRYVDPYVMKGNTVQKLSEIKPIFKEEVEHYRTINAEGLKV